MPQCASRRDKEKGQIFYNILSLYETKKKLYVLSKYKEAHYVGKFRKTKAMDIMTYKYVDLEKRYFTKFRSLVAN